MLRQSLQLDRPCAVIGDIHGEAGLLEELLDKLGDRDVFVVGDLCDRGPGTRRVLDLLVERSRVASLSSRPSSDSSLTSFARPLPLPPPSRRGDSEARGDAIPGRRHEVAAQGAAATVGGVLGNHDVWLRDWANGRGFDRMALAAIMGGAATLASYGVEARAVSEIEAARWAVPPDHAKFLEALPLVLDLQLGGERFVLVHAGIPDVAELRALPEAARVDAMLRSRQTELLWRKNLPEEVAKVGATLVMGHVPLERPVDLGHVIAIDTGAGTTAPFTLTAVLLPERTFVTARRG